MTEAALEFPLSGLAATEGLARALARRAVAGDVIALHGELGAGKTTFARAFIRARAGDADIGEIPSPTFTLVQTYDLPGGTIWHFDLYRLARPEQVWELGLEEATIGGIALIEWPERLGDLLPTERLDVTIAPGRDAAARRVGLEGSAAWHERLKGLAVDA